MAMLRHMPNLADLIAPERDSVSDSCHEAAPREPWGYEGYMFGGGLIVRGIIVLVCDSVSFVSASLQRLWRYFYREVH